MRKFKTQYLHQTPNKVKSNKELPEGRGQLEILHQQFKSSQIYPHLVALFEDMVSKTVDLATKTATNEDVSSEEVRRKLVTAKTVMMLEEVILDTNAFIERYENIS